MQMTIFSTGDTRYYMPLLQPGEEKLWNFYYSQPERYYNWKVRKIQTSTTYRMLYTTKVKGVRKSVFERIAALEGKGSKMAFKEMQHRVGEPLMVLGIDKENGNLFAGKFAADEMQRALLSREYNAIKRLRQTDAVPRVAQYNQDIDGAFLKIVVPEGKIMSGYSMNDQLFEILLNFAQYSMNQTKEENAFGLVTCLSNGSFAPWNIVLSEEGRAFLIHWQHAADRPAGYDLIYFLVKSYLEGYERNLDYSVENMIRWLDRYYSSFGIEDYCVYLDTCSRMYAAQLESQGRYVESTKLRMYNRKALELYYKRSNDSKNCLFEIPKVLFIMHMPPPIHGASMVGKWIHESEVINSTFDCYYLNLTAAANITDIGKFSLSKFTRFFKTLHTVFSVVRHVRPELVYITPNAGGGAFLKDSIVVRMLKRMGCRVLAHFHNKGVTRYERKSLYRGIYKRFFNKLKVLLIVPSLYDDNKTFLRIRDVYFCPNGTPLSLEQEIEAKRNNEVTEIIFLSNMLVSKGVIDLLDALYLLRGANHKFHCTLIGAETSELSREQINFEIKSRFLSENVDFIGPRYGEDKVSYFEKADIMAFPTYYSKECFPLVILEAMEYKLPVVSTNEGGIPYSVIHGETGLICKRQNPISLAEALEKLILNPELRWKMGENGYKLRKEKFTLDIFEANLCSVLSRALHDFKESEVFYEQK